MEAHWNAAQKEMMVTGKMHNYMRMYWGKKVIEWTPTWQAAYRIALHLNNKCELLDHPFSPCRCVWLREHLVPLLRALRKHPCQDVDYRAIGDLIVYPIGHFRDPLDLLHP